LTVADVARLIVFPKFWLWGRLFYLIPWYCGDELLLQVNSRMPDYSEIRGSTNENDIWYLDPYNDLI